METTFCTYLFCDYNSVLGPVVSKTFSLMCVNRYALHCYCLHLTWEIYIYNKKSITKNRQEKYFIIAFSLKYVRMSKRIPKMVEVSYGFKMKT